MKPKPNKSKKTDDKHPADEACREWLRSVKANPPKLRELWDGELVYAFRAGWDRAVKYTLSQNSSADSRESNGRS